MSDYPEKLNEILQDFASIFDRTERAEMLIYYADRFKEVPERIAARPFPEEHRVQFCESEAYVWAEPQAGDTLKFHFAVENPQGLSAMAMAAILDQTLSGAPLEQAAAVGPDIVYQIFGKEISMGKGQGLMGMVSMVKDYAQRYLENPLPGDRS